MSGGLAALTLVTHDALARPGGTKVAAGRQRTSFAQVCARGDCGGG